MFKTLINKYFKKNGLYIDGYGNKRWYKHGKLYREDGPAIEYVSGHKEWWVNGRLHREDGPAIEYDNGHKEWLVNGKLHREDGPAVIWANGDKEWWINGMHIEYFHKEQFKLNWYKEGF